MLRKYLLIVFVLYLFSVALRIVGHRINRIPIAWKPTLLLGEFGMSGGSFYWNLNTSSPLWRARIATLLILPLIWVKFLEKPVSKLINKIA